MSVCKLVIELNCFSTVLSEIFGLTSQALSATVFSRQVLSAVQRVNENLAKWQTGPSSGMLVRRPDLSGIDKKRQVSSISLDILIEYGIVKSHESV